MRRIRHLLLVGLLAGCAARPEPHIYVLEPAAAATAGMRDDAGRRVIELKPVLVPDHLDTTDILLRTGANEITASTTGVWGERLSVGVTRALASALATRLPTDRVVTRPPAGKPAVQILVDVTALQASRGGDCVLTARWTILRPSSAGAAISVSAEGSFVARAHDPSDAAIVTAISHAIAQLADGIAANGV